MWEFLSIAWPGLLVLGGFLAVIVHASARFRRAHRPGFYRRRTPTRGASQ